jgi:hypothetical protein
LEYAASATTEELVGVAGGVAGDGAELNF